MKTLTVDQFESFSKKVSSLESWKSVFNFELLKRDENSFKNEFNNLINEHEDVEAEIIRRLDDRINKRVKVKKNNLSKLWQTLVIFSFLGFFVKPFLIVFVLIAFPWMDLSQRSLNIYFDMKTKLIDLLMNSHSKIIDERNLLKEENKVLEKYRELHESFEHNHIELKKNIEIRQRELNESLQHNHIELKEKIELNQRQLDESLQHNHVELKENIELKQRELNESSNKLFKGFEELKSIELIDGIENAICAKYAVELNLKEKVALFYQTGALHAIHKYHGYVNNSTSKVIATLINTEYGRVNKYVNTLIKHGFNGDDEKGVKKFLNKNNEDVINEFKNDIKQE